LADVQFIYDTVVRDVLVITRHRHGCCVYQRCLDSANENQRKALVLQVVHNSIQLMQDPFGNYVVQYILERANENEVTQLVTQLKGNLAILSMQKFSSNVIEKCLVVSPPSLRQQMISELADPGTMRSLVQDQFANYCIQRALLVANDEQGMLLITNIKPHLASLFQFNAACARRISQRVIKRFPKLAMDPHFSPFLQMDQQQQQQQQHIA